MRLISGRLKGIQINPPAGLPVRPTTDRAKEALFNILQNRLNWEEIKALDLFSGTGNISLELASRGVESVIAVDKAYSCCSFLKEMSRKHSIDSIQVYRENALKFVRRYKGQFDFIFADPPFDMPETTQIPELISDYNLLKPGGLLVIEHPSKRMIHGHPTFFEQRDYGYSAFSFFEKNTH